MADWTFQGFDMRVKGQMQTCNAKWSEITRKGYMNNNNDGGAP